MMRMKLLRLVRVMYVMGGPRIVIHNVITWIPLSEEAVHFHHLQQHLPSLVFACS